MPVRGGCSGYMIGGLQWRVLVVKGPGKMMQCWCGCGGYEGEGVKGRGGH